MLIIYKKTEEQQNIESFFSMCCCSVYVQPSGPFLQVHRRV